MSNHEMAAKLDAAMGYAVPPDTAKAYLSNLVNRNSGHRAGLDQYCRRMGVQGNLVRVRWGTLYSTVALQWDAAGLAPSQFSSVLYAQGQNDIDTVLGQLGLFETNLRQGAKMDSSQQIISKKHGFAAEIRKAAAVTVDNQALALQAIWGATAVQLQTGVQTFQDWGPIQQFPGLQRSISNGGAAPSVSVNASPQGWQSLAVLTPELTFGAGQTFRLPLLLRQVAGGGTVLPEGVGFEDLEVTVRHTFYGRLVTTITG